MVMALSPCTAAVTVSKASACDVGSCASGLFVPSLSSALLVRKNGLRKLSSRVVANYGIRSCQPYQLPGFGDVSRRELQRRYGAPQAYGSGVETTELGQEGVTLEDVKEAELDGGDAGGGIGRGDDNGGNGGGRGDGSGGEGEKPEKRPGLSMSQKLTLGYAVLVGVGGIMGFAKSGSSKSLMAGGGSASILYYVFLNLPSNPVMASTIGLGISGMLLFIMGSRFMESGKVFPAGVVSLFSLVMAGGYIHGIIRSAH